MSTPASTAIFDTSSAQAVYHHLVDCGIVGDYETVEAPEVAEHIGEQPAVSAGGNAVDNIERCHEAASTFFSSSLVRLEIFVEHSLPAHVHGVVVAATFGSAVQCEMLHTGHYLVVGLHIAPLVSAHHGAGDLRTKARVLAGTLGDTPPTWFAAYVDHGAECPAYACCGSLGSRYPGTLLDGVHIP